MTDAMARRGPDSSGILTTGRACLGHRRLSIFDLSAAGHQPMTAADRRLSLVFNGAIYNFRELRKELQAAGYRFASQTDTEVLLHGYDRWGIDGLVTRCRGMFAFALWDAGRETLFMARDRLGIKPLVYAEKNGSLAFASTIKALRRSGLLGEVNPDGIAEFLEHGYIADHAAIFVGAEKLPPATIAEWRPGSTIALRRYWHSPIADNTSTVTFEQAVERTERALHEAVALRLFADVPVSALLSGGIDSALVCWAAVRSGAEVTAFTVATPGHRDDESADAQATAREIGMQVTVLPMSADDKLDSLLHSMEAAYSEPFATQSALGMLRVSEAIRSAGFKVVLTGDGGDDVFMGYQRHRDILKAQRVAGLLPPGSSAVWRALRNIVPARGVARRGRNFLDYATAGLPAYLAAHDGLQNFRASGLLGERLANINPASRQLARDDASARDLLQRYLTHDLTNQFVGEYLTKVDGGTMYHGLEARSPFFDQSVWELAASLPANIRLHNGELKSVLRTIARLRISDRVAAGRKRGFSIPVEHWIATRWQAEVAERLADCNIVRQGWIRSIGLKQLLHEPRTMGIGAHQIWYLLVLEEWLKANAS